MHPVLIVFLSIFMPFFFIFLLVGPVYGGAYAGAYLYYGEEVARDALYPEYLYQTYGALWDYWMQHFSAVIESFEWRHIDREGSVVTDLLQLLDQLSVVDLTLADADVQLLLG